MADESFARERDGWRFKFGGMKVNSAPDSLPQGKYPIAVNVRGYRDNSVETRPGQTLQFTTGGSPITDLDTYTVLGTDDKPRILARDGLDRIWLDNGTQVGTLAAGGPGAVFLPFRPNESPNSYLYVANGADYQKFSSPNPTVVASKVGIAEPQPTYAVLPFTDVCEAGPVAQTFTEVLSPGGNWNTGGTASGWFFGNRSADIIVTAQNDPVSAFAEGSTHGTAPPRWSVQVSPTVQYQIGEVLYFNGTPALITVIEDVIAPLSVSMIVQSIYLFQGTAPSLAVIALQGITSPGKSQPVENQSGQVTLPNEVIATLRRGALVKVGSETTYVRSVTTGPDNQICIEVFLNSAHAIGETVVGLPTIIVNGVQNAGSMAPGTPIVGDQGNVENFAVAVGIGTLTTGAPGGGPTGTILARPTVLLNGWGPNAHVGPYETSGSGSFGWGLSPATTNGYRNPGQAVDGNLTDFADAFTFHTGITYTGCIFSFPVTASQSNMALNVNSQIPTATEINAMYGPGIIQSDLNRSAGVWYSLDNGSTWIQMYNLGFVNGGANFAVNSYPQQWNSVPLPSNQVISNVQVMIFQDAHHDMAHWVYDINISAGAASIGLNTRAFQADDYLHFSVNIDQPALLTELRLQFDIADGTFLGNYFYYSVRPSDLVQATAPTLPVTTLGAVQAILQQTDTEIGATTDAVNIGSPTVAGQSQWTEIQIPIRELIRVGGDPTKSLANINAVQVWVNSLGTINISVSSITFVGGGNPDVGDIGEPYRYRAVPYSSVTGVKGNPSPDMRYGVDARRQIVQVNLPSATYDPQIDTWWIFRFGGSVPSWRFIGSTAAIVNAVFQDNYDDAAATAGDLIEFDNFEPWPSVDVPFAGTASIIAGFIAVVTPNVATPNILRFLPGNLVNLGGQNVYTLRKRPLLIAGTATYQFEFVECTVGFNQGVVGSNGQVNIYEPEIARQFVPYMWGTDVTGTAFAVGDPLRAGTLYFTKNNNLDSAPDRYNIEIVSPSEPLLGGEVLDGLSFVGSSMRWWALYPQPGNVAQRYSFVQQPVPRGIAAPYAHCTDGTDIYFWAEDGIWSLRRGSLTDEDLYNIFPHEGVSGVAQSYGPPPFPLTVQPPDYSKAATFRLTYANYYLYATYQDSTGTYNTLVYDIRRGSWCLDVYATQTTVFHNVEQQKGTLLTNTALYQDLLMADIGGKVYQQSSFTNDNGISINCAIATNEFTGGDLRAPKQWGDYFLDSESASAGGITINPMSLGAPVAPATNIPQGAGRTRVPLGVGGKVVSDFMGLFFNWTDNFAAQTNPTRLHIWDVSFTIQPARTSSFTTFGTSFGLKGYMHLREIALAYVSTAPVTLTITSYDGQSPQVLTFPPTGGAYAKILLPLTANKGQLYTIAAASTAPMQIFLEDSEVRVGQWGRTDPYLISRRFSGVPVDPAPI